MKKPLSVKELFSVRKLLSLAVGSIMLLSLISCNFNISSYKAIGLVRSNNSESASMSFFSFEGKMVFRLESRGEGDIKYTAELESGNATVYYDYRGQKSELFSIKEGEKVDSHGGYVESGFVSIIIETDEKCKNGKFTFKLD